MSRPLSICISGAQKSDKNIEYIIFSPCKIPVCPACRRRPVSVTQPFSPAPPPVKIPMEAIEPHTEPVPTHVNSPTLNQTSECEYTDQPSTSAVQIFDAKCDRWSAKELLHDVSPDHRFQTVSDSILQSDLHELIMLAASKHVI